MLLYRHERSSTIGVLLTELRRAIQSRREGAPYDEAEGFAWRRAEWRVSTLHGWRTPCGCCEAW